MLKSFENKALNLSQTKGSKSYRPIMTKFIMTLYLTHHELTSYDPISLNEARSYFSSASSYPLAHDRLSFDIRPVVFRHTIGCLWTYVRLSIDLRPVVYRSAKTGTSITPYFPSVTVTLAESDLHLVRRSSTEAPSLS